MQMRCICILRLTPLKCHPSSPSWMVLLEIPQGFMNLCAKLTCESSEKCLLLNSQLSLFAHTVKRFMNDVYKFDLHTQCFSFNIKKKYHANYIYNRRDWWSCPLCIFLLTFRLDFSIRRSREFSASPGGRLPQTAIAIFV